MLILQEIKEVIATEDKVCDGRQMFFDFYNGLEDINIKMKYICDLVRIKSMKIQPTETYLHIEFVDTETGDLLEMNVKRNVHQKLIQRKIYPTPLIQLLNK